jgi:aryl-alcohol dehydrogenase-like predicted oxidoreductase
MMLRAFGRTGATASALGLGCGPLGDGALDDASAIRLVHAALDLGVRVFDSAPSYGASEARLGRALRGRRGSAVIVTKGGYGVPGVADWTAEVIARGVDRALEVLGTDYLDGFVLHSCDRERLARGDLVEPLVRAREAGKVRAVGYAGDGDALAWAVRCEAFDLVECSVSLVDQASLADAVPHAAGRGLVVLAKRALANAPWAARERPDRHDAGTYWDRFRAMYEGVERSAEAWEDLAIRFAAHAPGVTCALVGTRREDHLKRAVESAARGPLSEERVRDVRDRFRGRDWPGII